MLLALGLIGCAAVWWLTKKHGGLGAAVAAFPRHLVAGWAALAGAGMLLLHGNLLLAALLGIGGMWSLEGPQGLGRRLRALVPSRAPPERRLRTRLIDIAIRPDGSFADGRVRSGPFGGARIDRLDLPALMALLEVCRAEDPEGAAILEAYLDRRAPGWRVDAEGDRDPRAGGPAKPGAMTQEEAYQILGLERGASTQEIRSAHRTLMKRAHPDQGGSVEGAARVNAARDRLLNRHR
ncbi:DnaJ domain-containing protein [Methylobacterium sp. J-076]|uniref:DnaJ domain-containing protein n=1 Tax=Methylobacterium sp. J-076 TaxID=2836655 RepID=UPI001FBBA8C7|nr:DnaJ domain-containing protein [Methylobacterium sp. J-076]MCJ2015724.1 DnaJ domain-containing protein [Methylobacterium sp. J-076]